jgi:hypothetical protein
VKRGDTGSYISGMCCEGLERLSSFQPRVADAIRFFEFKANL